MVPCTFAVGWRGGRAALGRVRCPSLCRWRAGTLGRAGHRGLPACGVGCWPCPFPPPSGSLPLTSWCPSPAPDLTLGLSEAPDLRPRGLSPSSSPYSYPHGQFCCCALTGRTWGLALSGGLLGAGPCPGVLHPVSRLPGIHMLTWGLCFQRHRDLGSVPPHLLFRGFGTEFTQKPLVID